MDEVAFWSFALAHLAGILFGVVLWFLIGLPARFIERMIPKPTVG